MKILKQVYCKGKNFRVAIEFVEHESGLKGFHLKTKRLVDFEKREISEISDLFRIETFVIIYNMMEQMFDYDFDKKLKPELDEMRKTSYELRTYIDNER